MSNTKAKKPSARRAISKLKQESLKKLNASLPIDKQMYREDILCSSAHAAGLERAGVLTKSELKAIERGLKRIEREIETGKFPWNEDLEDIHINIETRLTDLIGDAGKKLHTGRSRNDQVATDLRLWVRAAIDQVDALVLGLQAELLIQAESEAATPMPGFTHLQTAQPVTFGHHLMAWVEMLERDQARLRDCRKRVNVSPLGSAALAGTSYRIDRKFTAKLMGFDGITRNSMDAVADRDFAVEYVFALALLMVHLSRMAEEVVLWCSQPFSFVQLADEVCTGSSIMPQKKNPDIPELIRGKSGRALGSLNALLIMLKGQPLAYNKDNQEDKEQVFDSTRTAQTSLEAFAEVVRCMQVNRQAMADAATAGHATATDLADFLVRSGVPFRDAYAQVAELVEFAQKKAVGLPSLSLEQIRQIIPEADANLFKAISLRGSLNSRTVMGGTAPARVSAAVRAATVRLGIRRT